MSPQESLADLLFGDGGVTGPDDDDDLDATPPAQHPVTPPPLDAAPAGERPRELAEQDAPPRTRQVSAGRQAWAAVRDGLRENRREWRRARKYPGGLFAAFCHWDPPSAAQQAAYAGSRCWVEPGLEGGWADTWGTRHQRWIGIPGTKAGAAWILLVSRPRYFWPATAAFLLSLAALAAAAAYLLHL